MQKKPAFKIPGKILVIAEKPSAAREMAAALGAKKQVEGAFESNEYVVSFAVGHLVGLKEPQDYKKEWAQWNFHSLPMVPNPYELKVLDGGHKQFRILKKYLRSNEFVKVVNACDAGREGELIFDSIYRMSESTLPIERLWTSAALTPASLLREFAQLKPGQQFAGLRMAARARSAADWLIGMNASRAVSLAAQATGLHVSLPVGRVQTPTLSFLVQREREIQNFLVKPFTVLTAVFRIPETGQTYKGRFEFKDADKGFTHQIFSAQKALDVASESKPASGVHAGIVTKVESREEFELPPLCFDLTELQKEANKLFGLKAEQTLSIAQALYEKHKCLSYPRTEYRHLTEDVRAQFPAILKALEQGPFNKRFVKLAADTYSKPNPRLFDNSRVGDHHGLIPTAKVPRSLTEMESKIYQLVANRLLMAFAPPHRFSKSLLVTESGPKKHSYFTRGKTIVDMGWKELKGAAAEEKKPYSAFKGSSLSGSQSGSQGSLTHEVEEILPVIALGQKVDVLSVDSKIEETKPPSRYTDATLLSVMQNPGAKMDAPEDREALKSTGLGTSATRAATLTRLEKTGYLTRDKKYLIPTEKAFVLFEFLSAMGQETLASPILTARWEMALRRIESGEQKAAEFNAQLQEFVAEVVARSKLLNQKPV